MSVILNNTVIADLARISERIDWSPFKGKRILVTGANGHIASFLTLALLWKKRHSDIKMEITAMSRDMRRLHAIYGDFADKGEITLTASDVAAPTDSYGNFDFIFHFAGNASPYFIAHDPVGILHANIEGTFRMAELASRSKGCKLIYASTREVYGKNTVDGTLDESAFGSLDPLDPRSCYPESKRAAEAVIEAYHRQHGMRYAVARIAHVYGPGMKLAGDGRVMSDFINNALLGEDIVLNSDGSALRSFCYITDAVTALLMIAATPGDAEVYNLSNETEEISVLELARAIAAITGGINVSFKEADPTTKGLYCAYKRKPLDCSRLNALGWQPEIRLADGLRQTIEGSSKSRM